MYGRGEGVVGFVHFILLLMLFPRDEENERELKMNASVTFIRENLAGFQNMQVPLQARTKITSV